MKTYLVTAEEMQAMDRLTIDSFGLPGRLLMENAGRGAVRMLLEHFPDSRKKCIGIMAGRGNNGGDGFVMARYLSQAGAQVRVFLLTEKRRITGDAAVNLNLLEPLGIPVLELPDAAGFQAAREALKTVDLWVDAMLGTGLRSTVSGFYHEVISFLNQSSRPIFAVDIPSGLNADTGRPQGICIRAAATATFAFAKIGHLLHPGADYTGRLGIIDIGIPDFIRKEVDPRQGLITPELIRSGFQPRKADAHKGATGHLLVLAGSTGKTGAAVMTAVSAMRTGAGLVTLAGPASLNAVMAQQTLEVMTAPLTEAEPGVLSAAAASQVATLLDGKKGLAVGPGLGRAESTCGLLREILPGVKVPMVIDADGLNLLSPEVEFLKKIQAPVIITPHPGEMARLIGSDTRTVQADRVACARDFAQKWGVHVVLKGAGTVVAHPDGLVYINASGNAGMAAGGMGDVLTGIIGGLLVQGYAPAYAARAGVFIHGLAADLTAAAEGPVGYLAGQVMAGLPRAMAVLMNAAAGSQPDLRLPECRGI